MSYTQLSVITPAATLFIFAGSTQEAFASKGLEGAEPAEMKRAVIVYKPITVEAEPTLGGIPKDIKTVIFALLCKENKPAVLRAVCREWKNIMDAGTKPGVQLCYSIMGGTWQKGMHIWYGFLRKEEMLKTYLGGSLIYMRGTAGEKIFRIDELKNPFAGTFDLSGLEEGKYLSINTGLRPGINKANNNKSEIWLIPWVLANKMGKKEGSYLQAVMEAGWDPDICPFAICVNWWKDGVRSYAHSQPDLNVMIEKGLYSLDLTPKCEHVRKPHFRGCCRDLGCRCGWQVRLSRFVFKLG